MPAAATLQDTIGDLVTSNLSRARLFESLGLDYCCGGRKSLAQACHEKGLDPATVLKVLVGFDEQVPPDGDDASWADASLTALADHIERTHHAYLKVELPRLAQLVSHVAERHGRESPHLIQLRDTFLPLKMELQAHIGAEEEVVFP
ncbi:MAG: iron-sulfur cluster repair di-iron protein, partial [Comamonadaceae bacterium]